MDAEKRFFAEVHVIFKLEIVHVIFMQELSV